MKHFLAVLALLLGITGSVDASIITKYHASEIRRYVEQTPHKAEKSLHTLSEYLSAPFDSDYEKAMAIAYWVAAHIYYDAYLYHDGKVSKLIRNYNGQTAEELLTSRVGICGDFALLFKELCAKAGIKVKTVSGYAFPVGSKPTSNSGHAWSYFVYEHHKIYVDTTFMAEGTTGVKGRGGNLKHKRALKSIQRQNRYRSTINDFDPFYFDFNYQTEAQKRGYQRIER